MRRFAKLTPRYIPIKNNPPVAPVLSNDLHPNTPAPLRGVVLRRTKTEVAVVLVLYNFYRRGKRAAKIDGKVSSVVRVEIYSNLQSHLTSLPRDDRHRLLERDD